MLRSNDLLSFGIVGFAYTKAEATRAFTLCLIFCAKQTLRLSRHIYTRSHCLTLAKIIRKAILGGCSATISASILG
jgi:hypothetical protein